MGSSFFGMPSLGNEKSSSSSSRKSKKSSSDKPKQPQRGLGVAQLEQIRMRSQLGCGFPPSVIHGNTTALQEDMRVQGVPYAVPQSSTSYPYSQSSPSTSSPYGHHPNFMMVFGDERANLRYQDPQPSTAARWNPNNTGVIDSLSYTQPDASSRHLYRHFEDSRQRIDMLTSMGSSSQNSDSSDHEEVDLELRLSI